MHFFAKIGPMTHSFQGSLPSLPLPNLEQTLARHLRSMRPITSDEEYAELVDLSDKFRTGVGCFLQRYLWVKYMLSYNYVNDWWEKVRNKLSLYWDNKLILVRVFAAAQSHYDQQQLL